MCVTRAKRRDDETDRATLSTAGAVAGAFGLVSVLLAVSTVLSVEGTIEGSDGIIQYGLVFLLAAIPWIEILVVIPVAIAVGLDPVAVAVVAFLGNIIPIFGIILGYDRFKQWWDARRGSSSDGKQSRRRKWAQRVWDRYGLPGLALVSPGLTGVHTAAVLALLLGSTRRLLALWMTLSVALWTVVLTVGSVYGIEGLRAIGF